MDLTPKEKPQSHLKKDSKELSQLPENNLPSEKEPQIELKEDSKELSQLTDTIAMLNFGGLTPQGINFTNLLQAAFLCKIFTCSFSLLTICLA